jgi:hypothetical protein
MLHRALNDGMTERDEFENVLKIASMAYLKLLSQNVPVGTEKNTKISRTVLQA